MNPTVSIIIPCFNREHYISEAIESALIQGSNVEVIVVDDGSTDGSWVKIKSFPQARAFRQSNQGVSVARNLGLREAKGSYVQFLDSDDVLVPGAVHSMLRLSESLGPFQIGFGTAEVFGAATAMRTTYGFGHMGSGRLSGEALLRGVMPCLLPLFPKHALIDVGGFNEQLFISEDYELATRLHVAGFEFIQAMTRVVRVRDHGGPRLSRKYGHTGYERQIATLNVCRDLLTSQRSDGRLDAECSALAQVGWVLGRNAAREGCRAQAEYFFELSLSLGGKDAWVAASSIKFLYRIFSPYRAERLVNFIKRAVNHDVSSNSAG